MESIQKKPINYGNNQYVPMTRRYPNLRRKVLIKDSIISKKLTEAWDVEKDSKKVLDIYLKKHRSLSDERYWELLRTVWIISGSVKNADIFRKLMQSKRSQRYYFSTPEEAKHLKELPDKFTIYRAANNVGDGLSWTTSKKYAEWYLETYKKKMLLQIEIEKSKIFAYIERNLESEILIL